MMFRSQAKRIQILSATVVLLVVGTGVMAQPRVVPPPHMLALVGVTSVGARTQAWLVDLSTRQRATLSVGESAFGYRLKRVSPERVVLTRGGQDFPLRLGEKDVLAAASRAPIAAVAPPPSAALPEVASPPVEEPRARPAEPAPPVPEPVTAAPTQQRDVFRTPELYPGYPFSPRLSPEEAAALGVYPGYYSGAESPYYSGLYPPFPDALVPYPGAPSNYPAWAYPGVQSAYPAWAYPDPTLDPLSARYPAMGRMESPWTPAPAFSRYDSGAAGPRWNPQRSRRYSGHFGGGAPSNPQTLRRRRNLFR